MAIVLDGTTGITTPGLTNTGTETIVNLTTTGNTTLGDATTDTLTVGVTGIVKDSSSRVLINLASTDGGQLNVLGNTSTTTRAYLNATLRNSRGAGTHYGVISWNGKYTADAWIGQVPGTDALCFGHDAGTTIAESMRLATSGELMLGTTTAGLKLTVQNGITIVSGDQSTCRLVLQNTTSPGRTFSLVSGTVGVGNDNFTIYDNTASATRFTIASTGQVGINATPAAGNTFRVINIGSDNAVQFGNASNGVYLPNGGTSFSAYSDIRLKNITGRYETPLKDIAKLDAIKFTWKNDEGNKPCVGVSAQSVETVIPEAIDRSTNFNAEGDTTEYLSVKYTELIPLMIASIQELKAINDTQTATITSLTTRITALETP